MKKFNVAVVGATGAVGKVILQILAERKFPVGEVYALASANSAGKKLKFGKKTLTVQDLAKFDFTGVHIGLFSPGASVSKIYAPKAAAAGCVVIDNTSQFRMDPEIPLVVPEVNPQAIKGYKKRGIIANPNCSTIQMVVALKPIYDAVGITRINVATYQSVSGTGQDAIEELRAQSPKSLAGKPVKAAVYPKQIAFNVLPHIDVFTPNGYTKEEMKMVNETQKILGDTKVLVNPTTARVPVFYGHSEAVHIETKSKLTAKAATKLLKNFPGITVFEGEKYPTAAIEGTGTDDVYVGRLREDITVKNGLNLWVVADNLRKGAALNSIQIAEALIDYL